MLVPWRVNNQQYDPLSKAGHSGGDLHIMFEKIQPQSFEPPPNIQTLPDKMLESPNISKTTEMSGGMAGCPCQYP